MTETKNHTFVLCAYKESQFLEECVQSLLAQTVKSKILISTSTPNDHIKGIAEKYNLPLIELQPEFDKACKLASNDYWAYDGVHPTIMGHELIKREWIKKFNEIK